MANDKKVKGVIIPRHDTAINWKEAKHFIPAKGELIVYDADNETYSGTVFIKGEKISYESSDKVRFKFGDGATNVNLLPFVESNSDIDINLDDYATTVYVDQEIDKSEESQKEYVDDLVNTKLSSALTIKGTSLPNFSEKLQAGDLYIVNGREYVWVNTSKTPYDRWTTAHDNPSYPIAQILNIAWINGSHDDALGKYGELVVDGESYPVKVIKYTSNGQSGGLAMGAISFGFITQNYSPRLTPCPTIVSNYPSITFTPTGESTWTTSLSLIGYSNWEELGSVTNVDLEEYATNEYVDESISSIGIENYATTEYVNESISSKVSSVLRWKGTVESNYYLPELSSITLTPGDVYHIKYSGEEYVWVETSENPYEWTRNSGYSIAQILTTQLLLDTGRDLLNKYGELSIGGNSYPVQVIKHTPYNSTTGGSISFAFITQNNNPMSTPYPSFSQLTTGSVVPFTPTGESAVLIYSGYWGYSNWEYLGQITDINFDDYATNEYVDTNVENLQTQIDDIKSNESFISDISPITITDASEASHLMEVSLANKNLMPYPYIHTTKTENGITFTDNGDGSITISGTATQDAYFYLCAIDFGNENMWNETANNNGYFVSNCKHFFYNRANKVSCIVIPARTDYSIESITVKPQIELGTTATPYTPHIADFSSVNVKRYGKNLLNLRDDINTGSWGGITYTWNSSTGEIILNGTNTFDSISNCLLTLDVEDSWFVEHPSYTISLNNAEVNENVLLGITNQDGGFHSNTYCSVPNATFTQTTQYTKGYVYIRCLPGCTVENFVLRPQIEFGITATEFEPCAFQITTANADGTVNDVISLPKNNTIIADTEGVIINCKYLNGNYSELEYRQIGDLNKYLKIEDSKITSLVDIIPSSSTQSLGTFTNCWDTTYTGNIIKNCGYYPYGGALTITSDAASHYPDSYTQIDLVAKKGLDWSGNTLTWGYAKGTLSTDLRSALFTNKTADLGTKEHPWGIIYSSGYIQHTNSSSYGGITGYGMTIGSYLKEGNTSYLWYTNTKLVSQYANKTTDISTATLNWGCSTNDAKPSLYSDDVNAQLGTSTNPWSTVSVKNVNCNLIPANNNVTPNMILFSDYTIGNSASPWYSIYGHTTNTNKLQSIPTSLSSLNGDNIKTLSIIGTAASLDSGVTSSYNRYGIINFIVQSFTDSSYSEYGQYLQLLPASRGIIISSTNNPGQPFQYNTAVYREPISIYASTLGIHANLNSDILPEVTDGQPTYSLGGSSNEWYGVHTQYLWLNKTELQTSDRSAKCNINYLSDADTENLTPINMSRSIEVENTSNKITTFDVLNFVEQINPATFIYKNGEEDVPEDEAKSIMIQLGLIADDVCNHKLFKYIGAEEWRDHEITPAVIDKETGEVLEEAVTESRLHRGLKPLPLTVAALTTCKHLMSENKELRSKNEELESRLETIEAKLALL